MVARLGPGRGLLALGGLVFALLTGIAVRLPVDYWDGYDYLTNARFDPADYELVRPPMLSLLLAPAVGLHRPGEPGLAVHVWMVLIAAAAVAVTWRLLRESLPPAWAALGTGALLLNPLTLHYAPFAMADVPSMLFVALALLATARVQATGSVRAMAGLAVSVAALVATKYPAALLGFAVLIAAAVTKKGVGKIAAAGAAGAAIFYALHVAVFAAVLGPAGNPFTFLPKAIGLGLAATGAAGTDPIWEYGAGLAKAFTPPLLLIAGFGGFLAAKRRTEADVLHGVWALLFLGAMTFGVSHKEARYLFPVLPSVAYFVAVGLEGLHARVKRPLVVAALLIWPTVGAAQELARFTDPVYARPFMAEAAQWALARTPGGQPIVMLSPFAFSVYPKDPVWLADDEFFYFHTFNRRALRWFFGRPVRALHDLPYAQRPPAGPRPQGEALKVELFPEGGVTLSTTAVRAETAMAATLPEPPPPLKLEHIERQTWTKDAAGAWPGDPKAPPAGFRLYARRTKDAAPEPYAGQDAEVLELIRTETLTLNVRQSD